MTKKYIAKSVVSISLCGKRIAFYPDTKGGSYYTTSSNKEIKTMERHPSFGKLFTEDKMFAREMEAKERDATKLAEQKEIPKVEKTYKNVSTVTNCSDATIYLQEYGEKGLRSKVDILAAAERHGIKFTNLK